MATPNLKMVVGVALAALVLGGVGRLSYILQLESYRGQLTSQCFSGKPDGIRSCTKLIQREPNNHSAYSQRAYAYNRSGDRQRALDDYNKALALEPNDVFSLLMRGGLFAELKQYQIAINDFTAVISTDTIDRFDGKQFRQSALRRRAEAYEALGQYELAIADYTAAIDHDPTASWLVEIRARLYNQVGHFDKAIKDFNVLLQNSQDSSLLHFRRGQAYFGKKNYQRAIEDFNRAIEIAPRYTAAILYRADIFIETGQKKEAIAELRKALALDPAYTPARRVLQRLESEVSGVSRLQDSRN